MKIVLQQSVIIVALLFGVPAQATGFASHDAVTAGRATTLCSGVNGTGQPDQTREKSCTADGRNVNGRTLRGRYSS